MHDSQYRFRLKYSVVPCALILTFGLMVSQSHSQSPGDQARLYFFTNAACGPCRQVEPEIAALHRAGYPVMKVETDRYPQWAQHFEVRRTPTVVLVANQSVVARRSGFIDAATMQGWFRGLEATQNQSGVPQQEINDLALENERLPDLPRTYLKGTQRPGNQAEQRALNATVRLKVEDDDGSSFATGTVVHFHRGDALVLTCGHVFRESGGRGKITAEYGFGRAVQRVAPGELLFFDAEAKDVALVSIKTDEELEPVEIAPASYAVNKLAPIFSIGCDHGSEPSIRHTKLKNQAKYDGVEKYEIYGRPVNGRSGGGLFTPEGKLVGVCNAAVVDVDEGVYAALDTVHWQFQKTNLDHLFQPQGSHLMAHSTNAQQIGARRSFDHVPVKQFRSDQQVMLATQHGINEPVRRSLPESTELIVVVRNGSGTERFAIDNPSPDLVRQLRSQRQLSGMPNAQSELARLRREMPNLQGASGKNYRTADMRAQSPK